MVLVLKHHRVCNERFQSSYCLKETKVAKVHLVIVEHLTQFSNNNQTTKFIIYSLEAKNVFFALNRKQKLNRKAMSFSSISHFQIENVFKCQMIASHSVVAIIAKKKKILAFDDIFFPFSLFLSFAVVFILFFEKKFY